MQGNHPRSFAKDNIAELIYSAAPAGGLLRVRRNDEATLHFHGFTKTTEPQLLAQLADKLGLEVSKVDTSMAGHNWGKLSVHGKSVAFQVCLLELRTPAPRRLMCSTNTRVLLLRSAHYVANTQVAI